MSKLKTLIKEFCPNGVEYKNLDKVCSVNTGTQLNKEKLLEDAEFPVINGGINPSGYWHEYNTEKDTITISQGGASAGFVKYMEKPFWAGAHCYTVKLEDDRINYKYLYYFIKSIEKKLQNNQQGAGIPSVSRKTIYENLIPIPPKEVQEEIVHILDDFTQLLSELSAELEERQKQFDYYESALLNNKNYKLVKLEDVCNISAGGTPSKTKAEYWQNGTIKWLGSTVCKNKKCVDEVTGYITEKGLEKSSAKIMKKKTTLIAMVGATIGKVAFLDFEATTNQNVACLYPKNEEELDADFLYFACRNLYSKFIEFANGKFSMASLGFIRALEIPLPDIKTQKELVYKLEKIEKLCNNNLEGIPAEIEARQIQYEHYREKLLSFEEMKK